MPTSGPPGNHRVGQFVEQHMNRPRSILVALVAAAALAACSGDPETTTTTTVPGGTVAPGDSTTTTSTTIPEATATTLRGQIVTDYQTVARLSTDNGEVLHIVIPIGGYTDIDLYNFIADLKEADPDLWGAEVFDDPEAATAFATADGERSEAQATLVQNHHLVSLVSGDTIRYQGPFASFGESTLGS